MSSLRSVLGFGPSRVKKRSSTTSPRTQTRPDKSPRASSATPGSSSSSSTTSSAATSPTWTAGLRRTKSSVPSTSTTTTRSLSNKSDGTTCYDGGHDVNRKLQVGVEQQPPRNIEQAQRHVRAHMFDDLPLDGRAVGMSSTKIATTLRYRRDLPPLASTAHVQAVVLGTAASFSPTAAERELARLVQGGTLRRIVVPLRKKTAGDLIILGSDLEDMIRSSPVLDRKTKDTFARWLRDHPAAQTIQRGMGGVFGREEVDDLVRAGFLTVYNDGPNGYYNDGAYSRPEDLYSMISLENVSRAVSGSIQAVGGEGAVHEAGGTGVSRSCGVGGGEGGGGSLTIAVPGTGVFLKLVSGALEHLQSLLEKTQFREMPEQLLKEKWDGGVLAADKQAAMAKKARGEFSGVLPGRTKKWKDFKGLAFEWVLHEAVGAGLVEMFDTRSVGRGVRLVS